MLTVITVHNLLYEVNLKKAAVANKILNLFITSSAVLPNFSSGTSLLINTYEKVYGSFLKKIAFLSHIIYLFCTVSDHATLFQNPFKFISKTIQEYNQLQGQVIAVQLTMILCFFRFSSRQSIFCSWTWSSGEFLKILSITDDHLCA